MSKYSVTPLKGDDPSVVGFVGGGSVAAKPREGKRTFTVRLEGEDYELLQRVARIEDRSMQKALQRILVPALRKYAEENGLG